MRRNGLTWSSWILIAAAGLVGVPALVGLAWGYRLSEPEPESVKSEHWDGEQFRNQKPVPSQGLTDILQWQFTREPGEWTEVTDAEPGPPPVPQVARGEMRVTLIGHATTLIQMDGVNILTDPIWSERASPVSWAGPERFRPPGVRFEDLPEIDAVVISHNHYDHLDLPTLKRLEREHAPRFYVGLGNAALLRRNGLTDVVELDWWDAVPLNEEIEITATPAQHFSGRGLFDRNHTLWAGYVLSGTSGTAYFAGDTGWGPHFRQVRERFGPPRLALLPIGAYKPRWFMAPIHLSPSEAVEAHEVLAPSVSVATHYGTFNMADDGQGEAVRALHSALQEKQVPESRFWTLEFGEGRNVPPLTDRPDTPREK
jgi:L-ascorbate metabolism protein UlaG (beta-lactamase superfamily)